MEENEITVKANCSLDRLKSFLLNNGFKELENYYFTDIFLIPAAINIYEENTRDILKKAILLREANGITTNRNSKKMVFKKKEINEIGEIVSQTAIKCSIDSIEEAKKIFYTVGFKELMKTNELHISFIKDNFKIIVQKNIDNNYVLIEAETNMHYTTIKELQNKIKEIKDYIDLNDFFVKKAEIELQRIKEEGEVKNG